MRSRRSHTRVDVVTSGGLAKTKKMTAVINRLHVQARPKTDRNVRCFLFVKQVPVPVLFTCMPGEVIEKHKTYNILSRCRK